MPPTRRKAPFWSPRASDTHSTNAWVPPKWAESISGAETMRISSGANTSESRDGFRSCMTHAPKKTPIKKRATAEKWLQCGWKCKRHGELAESGCLISVEGVPFSREEPQYKHKEYGQQCAHKAADIHDLYLLLPSKTPLSCETPKPPRDEFHRRRSRNTGQQVGGEASATDLKAH